MFNNLKSFKCLSINSIIRVRTYFFSKQCRENEDLRLSLVNLGKYTSKSKGLSDILIENALLKNKLNERLRTVLSQTGLQNSKVDKEIGKHILTKA